MTAYRARANGRKSNGRNIKDLCQRVPLPTVNGFWGMDGFVPTAPNEWLYTWQGIDCPVFQVIELDSGEIKALLEGGEIQFIFSGISHIDVKDFLDNEILRLMRRLQADVDALIVIGGEIIGEEIPF